MIKNNRIFNLIRENCSQNFKNRINKSTDSDLSTIWNTIFTNSSYQSEYNEFLNEMINKIGLTLFRVNSIKNKFEKYFYYSQEFGRIIEESMVTLPLPSDYKKITNNGSVDPFIVSKPEVLTNYISNEISKQYSTTIFDDEMKKAFSNEYGLFNLISQIVQSLSNANKLDEYTMFLDLLNATFSSTKYALSDCQKIENDFKVVDKSTALKVVQQIKQTLNNFCELNSAYNYHKQPTLLNAQDIVIFLRSDVATIIQTELLASSFNKQDLGFTPVNSSGEVTVEIVNNFGGQGSYKKVGKNYTKLFKVYDADGKFSHLSETENGTKYAGDVYNFANYQMNGGNSPSRDIVCLICDKRLPIITINNMVTTSTYNSRGLYTNHFLTIKRTVGYSLFSNLVVISEAYDGPTNGGQQPQQPIKKATFETRNSEQTNVTTPTNANVGDIVDIKIFSRGLTKKLTQNTKMIDGVFFNGVFYKNTTKNPYNFTIAVVAEEKNVIIPALEVRKNIFIPTPTTRDNNTYYNIFDNNKLFTLTVNSNSGVGTDPNNLVPILPDAYESNSFGDFLITVEIDGEHFITFNRHFIEKISNDFDVIKIDPTNNSSVVIYKNRFNTNVNYNQKLKTYSNTKTIASFLAAYNFSRQALTDLPYCLLEEIPLQIVNNAGVDMIQKNSVTQNDNITSEFSLIDTKATSDANVKRKYFTVVE